MKIISYLNQVLWGLTVVATYLMFSTIAVLAQNSQNAIDLTLDEKKWLVDNPIIYTALDPNAEPF